jgi:hypothetical protein
MRVILLQLRSLAFLDPLRPPVEVGSRANEVGTRLQGDAAGGLGVLQVVDRGEMTIGKCGIRQWPQMLGGLEFRRIRRQEEQMDMLRDTQLQAGMPPRAVQDEDNLLRWAGVRTRLTQPQKGEY